jgi:hypothetical protein
MKIAIQAVPCRKSMVENLLTRLPSGVEVCYDTEYRGALWSFETILKNSGGQDVLMMQDDTIVPRWFMREFEASLIKGEVMSYFMGISKAQGRLYEEGYSYAKTQNIWGLSNYYPADFIEYYLAWADKTPDRAGGGKGADDVSVRSCLKSCKRFAYLTLPNILNHQESPSTMGNPCRIGGVSRLSSLYGEKLLRAWDKTKIGKLPK